ncbi:M20 family metallopeptidase [Clostridium akagii]|uniref:M20 family metallopeptidase n=1 Tax=Clostridium akagii TaxID=91623 RepID=UPI00047B503F|nr:M20 family metallopeptidase [Clostridium akagii]
MDINSIALKYKDYMLDLRRHFHSHPELSFKEYETSKRIKKELDKMGIPYKSGNNNTSILATIEGHKKGKTIALRTDMDALSVTECTTVSYKSQNKGCMHACGHDAHMASLLGAAKILKEIQHELPGTVKLIFQPGEEMGQGAKKIIEQGILDGIDSIFGLHVISDIECGKISIDAGPKMASADTFKITVTGKGGHGAKPNQGIDALVVASAIVLNLQSIVSREIDPLEPAVVSIGTFKAGTQYNIIADNAELFGTARCFNNDVRKKIPVAMRRIIENTAKSYGATANLDYSFAVAPVINDIELSKIGESAVTTILSEDALLKDTKLLISEDFSEYTEKIPSVFALVGARNEKKDAKYPHHNEKFNVDEDCLLIASALHAQYAYDYLTKIN